MKKEAMQECAKQHKSLAKAHEAMAATCKELSACYKSEVASGLRKATERDHYQDMHDAHKAASECHGKLCDNFTKAAALPADVKGGDGESSDVNTNANGDASAKAVTAAVDSLRADFNKKLEEFGKTLIPSDVRGVLPTGLELIPRSGSPTPQSDVAPETEQILGPM